MKFAWGTAHTSYIVIRCHRGRACGCIVGASTSALQPDGAIGNGALTGQTSPALARGKSGLASCENEITAELPPELLWNAGAAADSAFLRWSSIYSTGVKYRPMMICFSYATKNGYLN